jgi:hypothetical protein
MSVPNVAVRAEKFPRTVPRSMSRFAGDRSRGWMSSRIPRDAIHPSGFGVRRSGASARPSRREVETRTGTEGADLGLTVVPQRRGSRVRNRESACSHVEVVSRGPTRPVV